MTVIVQRGEIIRLGTVGENNATEVVFDITEYEKAYPGGSAQLIAQKGTTIYLPKTELSQDSKYTITESLTKGNYFFEVIDVKGQIVFFTLDQDMTTSDTLVYDMSKVDGIYNLKLINNGVEKNVRCNYMYAYSEENGENTLDPSQNSININGKTYKKTAANFEKIESGKKYLIWLVTKSDTSEAYLGRCYFNYVLDNIIKKSEIFDTIVTNSLNEDEEEAPAEYNWVEDIISKASFIENNINDSFEAAEKAEEEANKAAGSEENAALSATEALNYKEEAAISEDNAETWAVGTKNNEQVIIEDSESEEYQTLPHSQNNAKYYSEEAEKSSESASNSEKEAKAWANGEGTQSGDLQFENNAKYYSEKADESRVNAADSEKEAKAWANGEEAQPGSLQFENNAKYYSEESRKWAISEEPIEDESGTFKSAKEYASDAAQSMKDASDLADAAEISATSSKDWSNISKGWVDQAREWAISEEPIEDETGTFKSAKEYASDALSYVGKAPKIEGGFWWIWNVSENKYENTGITSGIYIDRTYENLELMQAALQDDTLKHGAILAISSKNTISEPQNAQLYQKIGEPVLNEDGTHKKDEQGNLLYQNFKLEYLVDLSGIQGFSISDIIYVEKKDEEGNLIPAGTPGQVDWYNVLLDNQTFVQDFPVYNGKDGSAIYLYSWELDENGQPIKQ